MADRDDSFLLRWSRRKAEARSTRRDEAADAAQPAGSVGAEPAPDGPTSVPVLARPAAPSATRTGAATLASTSGPGIAPTAAPTPGASGESAMRTTIAAAPAGQPASAQAIAPDAPAPPSLADVATLTRGSDYSRFVASDVAPEVKNAALKKLFSDPHFNVMDGLDIYIDDYGKADPLPPGMLRKMVQSQLLGLFADKPTPSPMTDTPAGPPTETALDAADTAPADPELPAEGNGDSPLPAADADPIAPGPSAATEPETTPAHEDADLQLQPDDAAGRPGDRASARPDPGREH